MTPNQRKQLKEARKRMIDLNISSGKIAEELGTSTAMISQLIHGSHYYPRYADELRRRYQIHIPDTRELKRAA